MFIDPGMLGILVFAFVCTFGIGIMVGLAIIVAGLIIVFNT